MLTLTLTQALTLTQPPFRKKTMPTFVHIANGSKTTFKCLTSALPKRVRVDGIVVIPQSSTATSVTFAAPPLAGVTVEVMYGEIRAVVARSPGTPPAQAGGAGVTLGGGLGVYGFHPTATVVNTAESIAPPVISFRDGTAENVVFTLDPQATEIDVWGDGRIAASR